MLALDIAALIALAVLVKRVLFLDVFAVYFVKDPIPAIRAIIPNANARDFIDMIVIVHSRASASELKYFFHFQVLVLALFAPAHANAVYIFMRTSAGFAAGEGFRRDNRITVVAHNCDVDVGRVLVIGKIGIHIVPWISFTPNCFGVLMIASVSRCCNAPLSARQGCKAAQYQHQTEATGQQFFPHMHLGSPFVNLFYSFRSRRLGIESKARHV